MNTQDTSTAHSPLPWIVTGGNDNPRGMDAYAKIDSERTGVAYVFGDTKAEREANAAFIVEACNNYERVKSQRDELLAALHNVSHDIADAMLWIQSKTESDARKFQGVADMLNRSRKQRIAAISRAYTRSSRT